MLFLLWIYPGVAGPVEPPVTPTAPATDGVLVPVAPEPPRGQIRWCPRCRRVTIAKYVGADRAHICSTRLGTPLRFG